MSNSTTYRPKSRLIDIGGRNLYLTDHGEGQPTVILEAGMGATWKMWLPIQPQIAQFARVLSYDRAGLGQSDPAPTPRTCQDMVDDLHKLLDVAEIEPPYILVASSKGGLNVRLFANQYPQDVVGMVLVDTMNEERYTQFETVLSEALIERQNKYLADPSRNSEHLDELASIEQLRATRRQHDFPLTVLTRGLPDGPSGIWPDAELQAISDRLQFEMSQLSPKGRQIFAKNSGHNIQKDEPELVVQSIKEMADYFRAHS